MLLRDVEMLPTTVHARILAIIGAIAREPGITLADLKAAVDEETDKQGGWGRSTLLNDVATLKGVRLLEQRRHRQGYYLTGQGFTEEELRWLLNGLRLQAEDLGNPQASVLYDRLLERFRRGARDPASLGYPLEAIGNRPVVKLGADVHDLMDRVREPMLAGQRVLLRVRSPYAGKRREHRTFTVYPLQFIYHDVAWYLLAEHDPEGSADQTFATFRLDRLAPAIQILEQPARGFDLQTVRLQVATEVLRRGWGMALPAHGPDGQSAGTEVTCTLRFQPHHATFIEENRQRHPAQKMQRQRDDTLLYTVRLSDTPAVLLQFRRWILGWGRGVEVVAPDSLRSTIAEELQEALTRYKTAP